MTDHLSDRPHRSDVDQQHGEVSQGPSTLDRGPEQLGGADAVPDTPDKNFPDDSSSPGRGSAVPDDDASLA